ncbi:MAG: hypothetical protein OEY48_02475 [Gammaproteobacteria bacterium]|nr:hypothetical protein [Gammaproteobacteria bacterium]MDH5591692.1 hypothetical protein [Gammaproteobacteria bacterium]
MKKGSMSLLAAGLVVIPGIGLANDFSTVTRVQYVLECMDANPKMNVYEAVHKCSCVADKLADVFSQREFEEANTGFQMRNMPADRGGMFRDDADVKEGIGLFQKTHADAYDNCRIRR